MAHLIEKMAYVGEPPWHGLGSKLTEDAPIDQWRVEAGLNWSIDRSPVVFMGVNEQHQKFDGRHVLYRTDNGSALSVVSDSYKIVQPGEVLEFYRDLIAGNDMKLHTAGSLNGGNRIWALAKMNEEFRLMGQDQVGGYLLLATSCDGSLSTTAQFTSIRVVCNNTLGFAVNEQGVTKIRVPHSANFNPQHVKAQLGIGHNAFMEFQGVMEKLAERKVDKKECVQWLINTFGDSTKTVEEQTEADAKLIHKVWDCVQHAPGQNLRSASGTAWGLVNGVTYYYDHVRNTRSADSRFNRAQFGDGAAMKQKALNNAVKLLAA